MQLPSDILHLILEYDGRIKYLHKERIYVNIIHKYDWRYSIVKSKISLHINLVNNLNYGILKYYIDIYYRDSEVGLVFCKKPYSLVNSF